MSTARTDKQAVHAVFLGETARMLCQKNAGGTVVGVFSRALYADFSGETVSFYDAAYGEMPFGVAVQDISGFLAAVGAEVGAAVTLADGAVRIGACLLPLAVIQPPPRIAVPLALPQDDRLVRLGDYLAAHGSPHGMLELLGTNRGGAADNAAALAAAFRVGDAAAAAAAATRLIGLGRGLTPSGDDYLCGFFSTLLAAHRAALPVPKPMAEVIAAVTEAAPARTSFISCAYLAAALSGQYCTVYAAAAAACLGTGSFAPFADIALKMGASSGTDTLCGALAAARLLAE